MFCLIISNFLSFITKFIQIAPIKCLNSIHLADKLSIIRLKTLEYLSKLLETCLGKVSTSDIEFRWSFCFSVLDFWIQICSWNQLAGSFFYKTKGFKFFDIETKDEKTDKNGILSYTHNSKKAGNNTLEITYNDIKWTQNFITVDKIESDIKINDIQTQFRSDFENQKIVINAKVSSKNRNILWCKMKTSENSYWNNLVNSKNSFQEVMFLI